MIIIIVKYICQFLNTYSNKTIPSQKVTDKKYVNKLTPFIFVTLNKVPNSCDITILIFVISVSIKYSLVQKRKTWELYSPVYKVLEDYIG